MDLTLLAEQAAEGLCTDIYFTNGRAGSLRGRWYQYGYSGIITRDYVEGLLKVWFKGEGGVDTISRTDLRFVISMMERLMPFTPPHHYRPGGLRLERHRLYVLAVKLAARLRFKDPTNYRLIEWAEELNKAERALRGEWEARSYQKPDGLWEHHEPAVDFHPSDPRYEEIETLVIALQDELDGREEGQRSIAKLQKRAELEAEIERLMAQRDSIG